MPIRSMSAKITPGRWFDLGWAAEADTLVVYVDQRPLFALRGAVRPDGTLGLLSNLPASVRTPQIRR